MDLFVTENTLHGEPPRASISIAEFPTCGRDLRLLVVCRMSYRILTWVPTLYH